MIRQAPTSEEQSRHSRQPAAGSYSSSDSLPGPANITRAQLPNGIVVLTRSNFNSPSVVASGYLMCGSLFDPPEKLGLADFTASALMRGTQQRSFQEIYDALESVGANLSIEGSTHSTGFGSKALVEDLPLLLKLVAESFRQPSFPEEHVERLRTQIMTRLAIRTQDTGEMASLAFDSLVYTNHPYRFPEEGYPETVQNITRQDLVQFHRQHYGPAGMVVTIVGGIDSQKAVELVAEVLGDWENPAQPPPSTLPPTIPLSHTLKEQVTIAGKSQADLILGSVGPSRFSEDYFAAVLGNSVLGQFGMMGRIGDAVREKAGLAYYAYSSLSGGLGPGPWTVSAGVDPANVDKTIELIKQEVARFTSQPIEEDELADSQANFIGRLPLTLESNGGVAGALLNLERYDLGLDYYLRYPDLLRAVTVEQVLETARRYLDPERLAIGVAGP
jgi:zinc protease